MGCIFSTTDEDSILRQEREAEAMIKFNIRVNTYSYPHHGAYIEYIEWCRAKYEMECLPEDFCHG